MAGVRPEKLTVSKIKSRLLNVAQTSLYRLTLPVPQAVRNTLSLNSVDYDNISLLCSEAALPGSTLTTHEVNNDIMVSLRRWHIEECMMRLLD